jgi:putative hemolysin
LFPNRTASVGENVSNPAKTFCASIGGILSEKGREIIGKSLQEELKMRINKRINKPF